MIIPVRPILEEMMSLPDTDIRTHIESLSEITESILKGEFVEWKTVIDAEGMLSLLARKINALLVDLKNLESPLANAGDHAPSALSSARNVIELMAKATGQVLDNADKLIVATEALTMHLSNLRSRGENTDEAERQLLAVKAGLFDIIGSQSYQDVARQKMEHLIGDLNQIRDWLLEVLVLLNIRKDNSPENIQKKTDLLREVSIKSTSDELKQDLVDDLLSEFGF